MKDDAILGLVDQLDLGDKIVLHAGVLSLDGVENIYHSAQGSDPAILGKEVAMELIHLGAHQLLRKIRQQLGS